jgi:hypothetical protein
VRRILILLTFTLFLSVGAYSQTSECPSDKVCLSREAAIKALQDADEVVALRQQVQALKDAVQAHKDIETNLKIELGKAMGELTGSQQMNVRQTAIIDVLLKNVRPKKFGLINF